MKKNILCKKGAALTLALVIAMGANFSVFAENVNMYSENAQINLENTGDIETEKND